VLDFLSSDESSEIFEGTARRFYRIAG